jgi:hypothetical protein
VVYGGYLVPKVPREEEPEQRKAIEVAADLGEVYYIAKDAEAEQKELRNEFFQAATVAQEAQALARKTVEVPEALDVSEAKAFALKYNPGWRVVQSEFEDDHPSKIILEEDPEFKGHSEVVLVEEPVVDSKGKKHPGYVVAKTVRAGSKLVDDERMKEEEPGLYDALIEYPNFDLLAGLAEHWEIDYDPETIIKFMKDRGVQPVLRNPSTWTPDELSEARPFIYEGPKTLALNVRYAKNDEAQPEEKD